MMVPFNHPIYPFPLNLEDRIRYVEEEFNRLEKSKVKFKYKKDKNGIFEGKRSKEYAKYNVEFDFSGSIKKETQELLDKYSFNKKSKKYSAVFE